MKPATVEPTEVLPPDGQISTTGGNLGTLQKQVRQEFDQFHGMQREAAWRGLRIGLMLLCGKRAVKHGDFGKWLEGAVPDYGKSQAHNLMSLSVVFMQKQNLDERRAFRLCENTDHPDAETAKVETTARKFIGTATLNELFYEHGIKVKPQGKIGGARDKKRGKITHEMRVEAAKGSARNLIDLIHADVIKGKDWILCDCELLQNLHDVCMDAMKIIGAALKKSH